MRKKYLLLVLMLVLVVYLPAQAQDEGTEEPGTGCDIDMSDTIGLLERAQETAKEGDSTAAVQMMQDARAQIELFEKACTPAPVPGATLDLSETYTILTRNGATFTFKYPAGWVTKEFSSDNVSVASSQDVLDDKNIDQPAPPPYLSGEALINVSLTQANDYGGTENLGDNPSPLAVLQALAKEFGGELGKPSEPVALTLGDRPAAEVNFFADTYTLTLILVEIGMSDNQFAHVVMIAPPGEMPGLEPTALAVASSFEISQ